MQNLRKCTIKELLNSNERFQVPSYQRDYDWRGETNAKDLFTDLKLCLDPKRSNSELFLGSMIFDTSKNDDTKVAEVIDGQQRLTTIMITIIAARNYAKLVLADDDLARDEQAHIKVTDRHIGKHFHRFTPSKSIGDVFSYMSEKSWEGEFPEFIDGCEKSIEEIKSQVSRISPVYKYAYKEISNYCGNEHSNFHKFMEQLYYKTYIIRIDVEEEGEAFEIFERTNARGKPLDPSDLLKNYLFSKANDMSKVEEIWDEISNNSGKNIIQMLKYFWISRKGHITNKYIYRYLRDYANEIGTSEFVDELREFSSFYRAFTGNKIWEMENWLSKRGISRDNMYLGEIARSCQALKAFRVTQPLPLLFSVLHGYKILDKADRKPKILLTIFRLIEFHHFINNKVCNRIGNEVEKLYADLSKDFYQNSDFYGNWNNLEADIINKTATKDQFKSDFKSITYLTKSHQLVIRYIFDLLANIGVKYGARQDLFNYDFVEQSIDSEFNIEHILARSLAEYNAPHVNELGNLMVIPKQVNSILGNDDVPTKIQKLSNPNNYDNKIKHVFHYIQDYVNDVSKFDVWDSISISKRTDSLAEQAFQIARYRYHYT